MVKKFIVRLTAITLLGSGFGLAFWSAGAAAIEARAAAAIEDFLKDEGLESAEGEDLVTGLTQAVHESYRRDSPTEQPILLRLRPYLSNRMLPDFLQVAPGAIEALYLTGFCDSASRTLAFALEARDVEAYQHNIITYTNGGHTVTVADSPKLGGRMLLDPLLGLVAMAAHGKPLSPDALRQRLSNGSELEEVLHPLRPDASIEFYRHFATSVSADAGEPLDLQITIDMAGQDTLRLGSVDGSAGDVEKEGADHGLSAYLHYLGNRYDRGWVRRLTVAHDTRMTFTLTGPVRPGVITSERAPDINGRTVTYEIPAGESLVLDDSAARRDWLRLRAYQNVDRVLFEQL